MVYATARSVREERSKQRFALQDFSLIRVSLVRGKSGWRIGSVENERNPFRAATTRGARAGVLRVTKLLRQFVHGEDAQPALYADVRQALLALEIAEDTAAARIADVFALRLLHKLGYIAAHDSFAAQLTTSNWTDEPAPLSPHAERAVTTALHASHL